MQKTLKWSPAQAVKKADNIISSKARETGDYGFKPSYLAESSENMKFIMSNEYMRIWFKERGRYEKDTYSREQIIKEESKIKRRFVQRMMTYRRPDKNYFLDEKVEKIFKKKENKDQSNDYRKYKYKPACTKSKEKGGGVKSKDANPNKAFGQTPNVDEDESKDVDSKNAEENQAIIVCQVDPNRCVPCQCSK